ncbi:hypothetical protein [Streptomyces sp. MP131-18]|uniref:hypothetical protein n=1 Tax=Streptomyces sp. MP131-18 TaxID=1857892 RepID=UPI00097C158C|nr:hypothetical protein [Streptomyces sp. MP131-18]ONK12978.1 hypothetical protein STBA_37340 [Streptomyces sp. MP131-18]
MPERKNGPELVEELRLAAEAVEVGPPPVEEMIRRGRALRARRRAAAGAGTAVVLAAALAAGLAWLPADAGPDGTAPPAPPAATRESPSPRGHVRVQPYERVVINDSFVMGLLPEGNQNYVVSFPEQFDEDVEAAKQYPGSNINPDSLSAGYRAEADVVELVEGSWRLDRTPARIEIAPDGQDVTYPATVVTLAGEPGWGTYYLDVGHHPAFTLGFRVIAYDTTGEVLAEIPVTARR